ncbi:putative Ig domain-containing protein [Pseudoalteromonas byunsanensis]|uniref:putative Ig domain-containing protein n=1 Tax=Pseudoalteromonas byunsanensis TaxID=327939 RepID=UPI0039EEEAF2
MQDGEGNTTTYSYVSATHTRVTLGQSHVDYYFDNAKRLTAVERVVDGQHVREEYEYNSAGQVTEIRNGLGQAKTFGYDNAGNLTTQSDADGVTVTRTYNTHNQLLSETRGDNTSYYIYDDANQRLRFTLGADNSVVEYRYNGLGQRVSQHTYTKANYTSTNRSLSALQSFINNQDKTAQQLSEYGYDFRGQLSTVTRYSSVNSQGQGVDGSTTRYVYDAHGKLLQETTPRGVLTEGTEGDFSTRYSYDGLGRVLSQTDANQAQTLYTYDDANQRIKTRFANNLWQTQVFDKTGALVSDAKGTILGSEAYGIERIYRDEHGRAVAKRDAQNSLSYSLYDKSGNLAATVSNTGTVTRYYYDRAGRVTQTTQYAQKVSTAGWLSRAGTLSKTLAQLDNDLKTQANNEDNRTTRTLYTLGGRKQYEVDAKGYVTEFIYNDKGQLTEQKQYTEPMGELIYQSHNSPVNVAQWQVYDATPAGATMTPTFDAEYGKEVMVLKGSGTSNGYRLRENTSTNWHSDNRIISWDMNLAESYTVFISVNTTKGHRYITYYAGNSAPVLNGQYATHYLPEGTKEGNWQTITRDLQADLAAVEPNVSITNINAFLIRGSGKVGQVSLSGLNEERTPATASANVQFTYNEAGKLEYKTDAEGYVTRYYYDKAGNEIATRRYFNKGVPGNISESNKDRISHTIYDAQGRVSASISADGALTTYAYNADGQKIAQTRYHKQITNPVIGAPLSIPTGEKTTLNWTYTAAGQVETQTHSDGSLTKYSYDKMNNLVQRQLFDSAEAKDASQVYGSDDFNNNVADAFTISNGSSTSIEVVDQRVRFKRLKSDKSEWPSLISKQTFEFKDNISTTIEVSTGSTLSGMYFYGGIDNSGSWSNLTLDRHAVYFDGNAVYSDVVRDGKGRGREKLMSLSASTTYVVNWTTNDEFTTLTVHPKGEPEQAVSAKVSTQDWSNSARLRFYNNPNPGANGSEVYVDNFKIQSLNEVSSTRYQYDLLGRKTSSLEGNQLLGDNLNHPVDTARWDIYDPTPEGATMKAVYDEQYGSEVLALQGAGKSNGYRLQNPGKTPWDALEKTISWDMKYSENFTVYISVDTDKGHRYITYNPGTHGASLGGQYAQIPLPVNTTDGNWYSVTRDLQADLQSVEPDNNIKNINAMLVRGSGRIGNVSLTDLNTAQLAQRGLATGASLMSELDDAFATKGDYTQYDVLGNIQSYIDKEGAKTLYYYDAQGNTRFEIDAVGQVTEFKYNGFNERTDIIRHHKSLSEAQIKQAGLVGGLVSNKVPSGQSVDSYLSGFLATGGAYTEQLKFDQRGMLVRKTDAQGYEKTFAYNAFTQLVKESQKTHLSAVDKQKGAAGLTNIETSFDYDNRGLLLTTTRTAGTETQVIGSSYDAFGRVITSTDANNNSKQTTHELNTAQDNIGRIVSTTQTVDGTARTIETRYDMLGRVLSVTDALDQVTRYEYNEQTRSVKVIQPDNSFVVTTRNALGKTASVAYFDAAGVKVSESQYDYDYNGNLTQTLLNGQVQSLNDYDSENRLTHTVDGSGTQVETLYDAVGRVETTIVDPDGLALRTEFAYAKHGGQIIKTERINTVVSGGNIASGTLHTTTTELDGAGRALSIVVRQGSTIQSQTSYQYDASGKQLVATKGSGSKAVSTSYVYDELGRLSTTQIGNSTTRFEYDANDNLIVKAESLGTQVYNDLNSSTGILNQKVTYYVYNEANQVTHEFVSTKASATAVTNFDGLPPIDTGPIDPNPPSVMSTSGFEVDDDAQIRTFSTNVTNKINLSGSVKRYSYNANGQLISNGQGLSELTLIAYQEVSKERSLADFLLNQTSVINGKITAYGGEYATAHTAYDTNGRKSLHIDAEGAVTQWHYNTQGNVSEVVQWGQRVSALTQTQLQKLKTGVLTASELTKTGIAVADSKVKTIYNASGQARFSLTLIEGNSASVKESIYDASGLLVKTIAYVNTVNYTEVTDESTAIAKISKSNQDRTSNLFYDDAGRLRFSIDALGYVTEHRYNEVSDIISTIKYWASIKDTAQLKASLDAGSLQYSELHAHFGDNLINGARISSFERDAMGRITWQRHADGTTESYSYYDNGLKASYTNQNGATWRYDYDNAGRLAYERGPQLTVYNWSGGSLSDIQGVSVTKQFSYDGLGNVSAITEGGQKNGSWVSSIPKAITHFSYDNAGRQISMKQNAAQNAPAIEARTQYDALGRAVSSTRGGITTLKIYDNVGNVRFEISGEGDITERRYNALGQEVSLIKYSDETTWIPNRALVLSDMVDSNGNIKSNNVPNLNVYASNDRRIDTIYDAAGRKVQVNVGNQSTRFVYNAFGQEVKKEQLLEGSFSTAGYKALVSYSYYNELGQQVASVDPGKYLTTTAYNAFGQVRTQTEYAVAISASVNEHTIPSGTNGNATYGQNRSIEYHYDLMGRVVHQVQSNAGVSAFTSGTNLQTRSHKITSFAYDKLGNTVQSSVRALNSGDVSNLPAQNAQVQGWEYDAVGRLSHTATASSSYTTLDLSKDLSGALSTSSGRHISSMGYDVFGNLVRRVEHANRGSLNTTTSDISVPPSSPNDKLTRHEYNTRGQLIAEYDALGNKTTHKYDALGQLQETRQSYNEWNHDNESYSFTYRLYHFDSTGKYIRSSGELRGLPNGISFNSSTGQLSGRIFYFSPDDDEGGHTSATITLSANYLSSDSAKVQTRSFSSKNGQTTATAFAQWREPHSGADDVKVRFTKYQYNRAGQMSRKSVGINSGSGDVSSYTWSTHYNAFGEVKKDDDGVYVYNKQGQLWKTTKGDGVLKTYGYDLAGRMTSTTHALNGLTDITRDASGNATLIKQPKFTQNGVTYRPQIEQDFDRWGNVIELKDARGFITQAQYNHANQVTKEILPLVAVTEENGQTTSTTPINIYHYDEHGHLIQKIDGNGHKQTFKFDERGNQVLHQDGENNQTHYKYDIFGRKVLTTDAENRTTTTSYDKVDRVVETGQFGVINNQAGQYRVNNSYEYDELGNRTHEHDAVGGVKSYKFDVYGNVKYARDEMGREKLYVYNSDGTQRHETYANLHSSTTPDKHKNTRYYDEYGNLQSGNDLGGKGFSYTYGKGWGENNSIDTLTNTGSATTKTDIGRLIRKQNDHGQDIRYTYYENGWVKSITDEATDAYMYFEYDKAGRKTLELRQSWDDLQRVIRHETTTQYDSHGRITLTQTKEYNNTRTSGDPVWVEGKILSRVTYRYDAVGNRRSMKVENGIVGDLSVDPSYKFYGALSINENTAFTEKTGDVATFFQALQLPNLEYSAKFYKQDANDANKWVAITKPDGVSFSSSGKLIGTPSYEAAGTYRIDVVASDKSKSPVRTFNGEIQLNIANVAAPIEVKPISTHNVKEGVQVTINLGNYFIADSSSRLLKYTVTGLPSGLSYNTSTGVISGTPSYTSANSYTIKVVVADKNNSSISREQSFTLRVSGTQVVTVGEETRKEINLTSGDSQGTRVTVRRISGPSFAQINNSNTLVITPSAADGRTAPYVVKYATYIYETELGREFKLGDYEYHIIVPDTKVVNQPLTAKNGTLNYKEGQSLSSSSGNVKQFFTNPDNDSLSYTATFYQEKLVDVSKDRMEPVVVRKWVVVSPPEGVSFNRAGYLQGTFGSSASGTYRINVTATESNRATPNRATAQITLTVENVKPPIAVSSIPSKQAEEGQSLSYNVAGYFKTDVTTRTLVYSATGLPSGVSINATTGVISSSGALKDGTAGTHRITVTATDKNNSSIKAQGSFTLSVNNINYITLNEGQTQQIDISSFGGTSTMITKQLSSGAPSWATISSDKKYLILRPDASAGRSSAYTFTLTVSEFDPELRRTFTYGTRKYTVLVKDTQTPNRAPSGSIANKTVSEGSAFTYNVASTFKDPDGDALTYTVRYLKRVFQPDPIDPRDRFLRMAVEPSIGDTTNGGSWVYQSVAAPSGLSFSSAGVLSGTPSYSTSGTYKVVVTATEQKSTKLAASREFTLTINNVVPNKAPTVSLSAASSVKQGSSITVTASASDSDGSIAQYEWQRSSGVTLTGSGNKVTIKGNTIGSQWVKVRVKDNDGAWSGWVTKNISVTSATVSNSAPVANKNLFHFTFEDRYFSYTIPSNAFTDPDGDTLTYSATGLPTDVRISGNRIYGTVTRPGIFNITITARDPKGLTASTRLNLEVEPGGFDPREREPFLVQEPRLAMRSMAVAQDDIKVAAAPMQLKAVEPEAAPIELSSTVATMSTASTTSATSATSTSNGSVTEYWFTYDGNNRVVHDGGNLVNGTITTRTQGQYIAYNDVGQQTLLISANNKNAQQFVYNSWGQVAFVDSFLNKGDIDLYGARATLASTPSHSNWRASSKFEYDAMGRVTDKREFFSANATLNVQVDGMGGDPGYNVLVNYGGAIKHHTQTRYNAAGEVTWVQEKALTLDIKNALDKYVPKSGPVGSGKIYISEPWTESSLKVQSITQNYVYDGAGMVKSYAYYQKTGLPSGVSQLIHRFSKEYEARDSYLEKITRGRGDTSHKESQNLQDAETLSHYDANGNRTRIEEHITDSRYKGDKDVNARYMRYDAQGKIISKVTGKQTRLLTASDLNTQRTYYNPYTGEVIDWQTTVAKNVGFKEDTTYLGRETGSYYLYSSGNYLGEINKSGTNSIKEQHFSAPDSKDSTVMARHQVQSGDTLKGIAKLYYGNEDLWYIIADMNGLGAGSDLTQGVTLDIPARANQFNSHDSFKPINLGEIIGNTDPSMPYVPPPPQAGCNALASIVMIAVAVVATIVTAGAAAVAMGAASSSMGIMAAGTAALGGSLGAVGVAAAAVGGFMGSVISQGVGKAIGAIDSFSLKNAFASGLTAGATAGMGSYLQGAEWANQGAKSMNSITGLKDLTWQGRAVMGVTSSISSVAANKLVGNQASFRWGNVAASAVTSGLGANAGQIGQGTLNPINGIVNAAVNYGADKLFGNQASWNFGNVAVDAFGNAIGNSIVQGVMSKTAQANQDRQAELDAMSTKLTQQVNKKLDTQLDAQLNETLENAQTQMATDLDAATQNVSDKLLADLNSRYDTEMSKWQSSSLELAERSNAMQAEYAAKSSSLTARFNQQMERIQVSGDAAFTRGVARGEAMYASGVRNREQIGVDLLAGVDVEGYLKWRESEVLQMQQWKKDNPNWSRLGDDLWDLGQSVADSSVSIWNTAVDMSSAYRRHDNYTDLTFELMQGVGSMAADVGKVAINLVEVGLSATVLPIYQELGYLNGGAVELEGGSYYTHSSGLGGGGSAAISFNPDGSGGTALASDFGFENFVRKNSVSFDVSLATGPQMEANDFLNGYVLAGGADVDLPTSRHPLLPNSAGVFTGHTYDSDPLLHGVGGSNPARKELYGAQIAKTFEFGSARKSNSGIRNYGVSGHVVRQQSFQKSSWDSSSLGEFLYGFQNMHFAQYNWLTK